MEKLLVGSARHLELTGLRELEYLMLNLPYTCNYRCQKCCNASRSSASQSLSLLLSIDEIKKLTDDAKDLGIRVLVVAGEGEPFLNQNIFEIIRHAHEKGLIPYIFTNGSRLDHDTARFLKDNNASFIINLDSLEEQLYEEQNGVKGSFQTVYANIQGIREIFRDTYSHTADYELRRVALNTVVSRNNLHEMDKIKEFCSDDFAFVCNSPMNLGRAAGDAQFLGVVPNVDTIPLGTLLDNHWCAYMRNGISVGANGDVLVCAYFLETAGHLVNIRNIALKDAVGRANAVVDSFYEQNGHSRCILRHPNYQELITKLRGKHD